MHRPFKNCPFRPEMYKFEITVATLDPQHLSLGTTATTSYMPIYPAPGLQFCFPHCSEDYLFKYKIPSFAAA